MATGRPFPSGRVCVYMCAYEGALSVPSLWPACFFFYGVIRRNSAGYVYIYVHPIPWPLFAAAVWLAASGHPGAV